MIISPDAKRTLDYIEEYTSRMMKIFGIGIFIVVLIFVCCVVGGCSHVHVKDTKCWSADYEYGKFCQQFDRIIWWWAKNNQGAQK